MSLAGPRWTPHARDAIDSNVVIALSPHPSTPADAWDVSASAERTADGDLRLRWVVRGTLDGLRVPPLGPLRRGDRLWEHTCMEAFIAAADTPAYVELNVAPSREWAAYAFTAYRENTPFDATRVAPEIVVRRDPDAITVDAVVALASFSSSYRDAALRVGLSVVIETSAGGLSYWAIRHPSARPDFHHADGFTLHIAPPHVADVNPQRGPST